MSAAESSHYDDAYAGTADPCPSYRDSPLRELYDEVCRWLPSNAVVHDLGCGTGMLAEALIGHGHHRGDGAYRGLDFSPVAISQALGRTHKALIDLSGDTPQTFDHAFIEADLRDWQQPENIYNAVFVCLETLEHLDDDLQFVARIPAGRRLVMSVPTFNSVSHVRWFPTVGSVWARYDGLLRFRRWTRVGGEDERGVVHLLDTIRRADSWGSE